MLHWSITKQQLLGLRQSAPQEWQTPLLVTGNLGLPGALNKGTDWGRTGRLTLPWIFSNSVDWCSTYQHDSLQETRILLDVHYYHYRCSSFLLEERVTWEDSIFKSILCFVHSHGSEDCLFWKPFRFRISFCLMLLTLCPIFLLSPLPWSQNTTKYLLTK